MISSSKYECAVAGLAVCSFLTVTSDGSIFSIRYSIIVIWLIWLEAVPELIGQTCPNCCSHACAPKTQSGYSGLCFAVGLLTHCDLMVALPGDEEQECCRASLLAVFVSDFMPPYA